MLTRDLKITSVEAMEEVFAKTVEKFGSVDVVVNNAGITDLFAPIGEVKKEYLEKLIAVNTVAPAMIAGIAARQFLKQEPKGKLANTRGVVCNVASAAAIHGHRTGKILLPRK
jgi:NAD(P)-dependent dehydrogenase (short-subunit alcohol dehydrogenase family)